MVCFFFCVIISMRFKISNQTSSHTLYFIFIFSIDECILIEKIILIELSFKNTTFLLSPASLLEIHRWIRNKCTIIFFNVEYMTVIYSKLKHSFFVLTHMLANQYIIRNKEYESSNLNSTIMIINQSYQKSWEWNEQNYFRTWIWSSTVMQYLWRQWWSQLISYNGQSKNEASSRHFAQSNSLPSKENFLFLIYSEIKYKMV